MHFVQCEWQLSILVFFLCSSPFFAKNNMNWTKSSSMSIKTRIFIIIMRLARHICILSVNDSTTKIVSMQMYRIPCGNIINSFFALWTTNSSESKSKWKFFFFKNDAKSISIFYWNIVHIVELDILTESKKHIWKKKNKIKNEFIVRMSLFLHHFVLITVHHAWNMLLDQSTWLKW